MGYISLAVSAMWFVQGVMFAFGKHEPSKFSTFTAYFTAGVFMLGIGMKQLGFEHG
jgi:hypothetical protein